MCLSHPHQPMLFFCRRLCTASPSPPLPALAEEAILDPSKVGVKLKADAVDIAYPPSFQSGGAYDLRPSAPCDDANLHDGGCCYVD